MKYLGYSTAVAALVVAVTTPAVAADSYGKWVSGELSVELQHENLYNTSDGSAGSDTYTTIELGTRLHLTGRLTLELGLTLEPVADLEPGEDRILGDHGGYADSLQLRYEGDDWYVHGGKFTATFGLDQDLFPGIYGDTFTGGYELVERLGVGGGVEFEVPDIAKLELKAAVFTRDSTALSGSLFTGRERLHVSDGGPGNTDLPESFSVALDAGEIEGLPGLALRTSVLRQAAGEGNDRSQWALSIGGAWEIGVGDDWTITPVIDYVHSWDAIGIDAADGISGAAENYLTAGVAVGYESWDAALVGGRRWDSQPGAADVRDAFVQVSAGYTFENDISVDLGWLYLDQGGVTSQGVGMLVAYGLKF